MKSRLKMPTPESMTAAQAAVRDSILATRGNLEGPFLAWMLSPQLADPAEKLGAFCRYQSGLELIESELLILYVAAHHACTGEQQIHEPMARSAGLSDEALVAIRCDEMPALATPRLRLLALVARELLVKDRISDDLYTHAARLFSESELVNIVAIIGYYSFVAYTLNAFDMRLE